MVIFGLHLRGGLEINTFAPEKLDPVPGRRETTLMARWSHYNIMLRQRRNYYPARPKNLMRNFYQR